MALQTLVGQARQEGATCLTLRVNRRNEPALRCYGRNGFRIVRDVTSQIGHGYIMDDHWMQLDLVASLTALEPGAPGPLGPQE
jgi:RimJ/RimL family protein N-acetyltransferase